MTVRKFRSLEEMTPPPEPTPSAPGNFRAAMELSRTCIALTRRRPPAGVRKYRSIEESNEARRHLEEIPDP